MLKLQATVAGALAIASAMAIPASALAQAPLQQGRFAPSPPPYADLADLADSAGVVLRAQVRKVVRLEPERSRGVRPGWGRFYIEAKTQAQLTGAAPLGEALQYLVDLPLDAKGKPPGIKKKIVLLFGAAVRERPGELRLVAPDAQLLWDAALEGRVRSILRELLAPDAPGRVTGVREAIHVPGTLAGEGETQIFLDTSDQSAASITVRQQPGSAPEWGVSFSEVLAGSAGSPPRDTLSWYRLACFLPEGLPRGTNLSEGATSRARAESDYRTVRAQLGRCQRARLAGW